MRARSLGAVFASRLRVEPAAWLLPLSCLLGYLAAVGMDEQSPGYPLAVAIRGHGALIVLAPIGAGCAAWKAGRYRRAEWPKRTWRRSPARLALAEVTTTAGVQLAAYAAVVAAVAAASAVSPLPWEPQLFLVAAAALVGWASLGFVIGWWVRTELAMPVVVVGSYLAIVFPDAVEPLWVRHLTGTFLGCCFRDAVLDAGAVRGPILLSLGVTAAALILVAARTRPVLVLGAAVIAAAAIAGSAAQVDHLGADPIAPRTSAVECRGSRPVVCTWPEQARDRAKIAQVSRQVFDRWRAAGLQVPERVSTRPMADPVPTIIVQTAEHPTVAEITAALALGAVPEPDCPGGAPTDLYVASQLAWADVAVEGGLAPGEVASSIGPDLTDLLAAVRAAPVDARTAWLHEVNTAVASCSSTVPGLPR